MALTEHTKANFEMATNHGLIFISGIGAQVKNTVSSKKDFRPQTSDRAPINGALRKDNKPCEENPDIFSVKANKWKVESFKILAWILQMHSINGNTLDPSKRNPAVIQGAFLLMENTPCTREGTVTRRDLWDSTQDLQTYF